MALIKAPSLLFKYQLFRGSGSPVLCAEPFQYVEEEDMGLALVCPLFPHDAESFKSGVLASDEQPTSGPFS